MSRDGSGIYSVPWPDFVAGTTIESAKVDANYADIVQDLNNLTNGTNFWTGQFKAAVGTVALPGITFNGDPNTGLYWVSADNIAVSVAGVKVFGWTAAGASAVSTDAGASAGPIITIYRDSASPAASDFIGKLQFDGEDSAGNTEEYAAIGVQIVDTTSTAEDGRMILRTKANGALVNTLTLENTTATLTSTNSGTAFAPNLVIYRESLSPAVNDFIGKLQFDGKESSGTTTVEYANIGVQITQPVAGVEDARLILRVMSNGSLIDVLTLDEDNIVAASPITVPNSGLHILDTNASHDLIFAVGSNLTADRTLTVTTGDANHTLDITDLPTAGVLASGTYTPTLTNTANIASSTPGVTNYMRVGDMVTVSGIFTVDPTTVTTLTTMGMSLPIASNFAAATDAGGTGGSFVGGGEVWEVKADTVNDRVTFETTVTSAASHNVSFIFMYRVV